MVDSAPLPAPCASDNATPCLRPGSPAAGLPGPGSGAGLRALRQVPSGTTSRRGSPAASAAIPPALAPARRETAGRPGSPALARSPRRNARRPAIPHCASRARPTLRYSARARPRWGAAGPAPRVRDGKEGINAQRQWLAGRAQRSQRIRDMGRLLEGAQCATGGEHSLARKNVIFPTNGSNFLHP